MTEPTENQRVDQGRPENGIGGEDKAVVVESSELDVVWPQQIPALQAVPDGQQKRQLGDDDRVNDRRRHQ